MFLIQRYVSQLAVRFQAEVRAVRCLDHSFHCSFCIKTFNAPCVRICDDRYAVIADHASCVIARELPHGQLATFVIHAQHGPDKIP